MGNLISFFAALDRLGETNEERAVKLNMSLRTFMYLKAGRVPRFGQILLTHADLAEALAEDAKAGRSNGYHPGDVQEPAAP